MTLVAYWDPNHFVHWYGDIDEGGLDYFVCFYQVPEPLREGDHGFNVSLGKYVAVSIVLNQETDRWEPYRVGEVVENTCFHVPAWVEDNHFVCDVEERRIVLAPASEWDRKRYVHGWWEQAVGYNPRRFEFE